MRGPLLRSCGVAVALLAVLAGGCAESSETFGTPAGMRARINELCDQSRALIEAGNIAEIRALADRIETEVSDVHDAAVETSADPRRYADALETGASAEYPACEVDVLPLTSGG
jgi:hypothetical protein